MVIDLNEHRKNRCTHKSPPARYQEERLIGVVLIGGKASTPVVERMLVCGKCGGLHPVLGFLNPDEFYDYPEDYKEDAEGWPLDANGKRLPIIEGATPDDFDYF